MTNTTHPNTQYSKTSSSSHLNLRCKAVGIYGQRGNMQVKHCLLQFEINVKPVQEVCCVKWHCRSQLGVVLKDDKILLHTPGEKPSLMLEPVLQIDFWKRKCRDTPKPKKLESNTFALHFIPNQGCTMHSLPQLHKFRMQLHSCTNANHVHEVMEA